MKQQPKGYGLKCHRVIRACCEAIGITDLYAKVEGSTNIPNLVKAFFVGLLQQVCSSKRFYVICKYCIANETRVQKLSSMVIVFNNTVMFLENPRSDGE